MNTDWMDGYEQHLWSIHQGLGKVSQTIEGVVAHEFQSYLIAKERNANPNAHMEKFIEAMAAQDPFYMKALLEAIEKTREQIYLTLGDSYHALGLDSEPPIDPQEGDTTDFQ